MSMIHAEFQLGFESQTDIVSGLLCKGVNCNEGEEGMHLECGLRGAAGRGAGLRAGDSGSATFVLCQGLLAGLQQPAQVSIRRRLQQLPGHPTSRDGA